MGMQGVKKSLPTLFGVLYFAFSVSLGNLWYAALSKMVTMIQQ